MVVMPNLKAPEILLILLVVLLLFGAKRLPDLAKSVGKSLKILKTEVRDNDDDRPVAGAAPVPPVAAPYVAPPAQPYIPPSTPPAVYTPPSTAAPADTNDRKQV
jgi:sec-independent protein translocase protein TatA